MKVSKVIFALLVAQILGLLVPHAIFCQSETLDIVTFTPPKRWSKTEKQGAVVYTDANQSKGTFCLLTVYAGATSAGSPSKDFAKDWNEFVVKPFKAEAGPKTQTQTTSDGWQAVIGGSNIDLDGGVKAAAILTVFSGFGRTASVLVIFNDESYSQQTSAVIDTIKLAKTKAVVQPVPATEVGPAGLSNPDPFPDKPGFQPQQPLLGPLKESITMADLVGTWDNGGANVTTYVNSSNGSYSGTDTTFFTENYTIHPDGTFEKSFQGRTSNQTVREKDSGTISLSGPTILVKFKTHGTYRYQFVAYMTLPNGRAVLTLYHIGETEPLRTPEQLYWACGHGKGFINCVSGDEWTLRPRR